MKTKILVGVLLLTLVAVWLVFTRSGERKPNDLNVILISIDTLRADHIGAYGYPRNTTPNIDKWAKGAFVFSNVRTVVPHTYPSFAALMTGKNPFSTGISTNVSEPVGYSTATLATILRQNNYLTAGFISNGWLRDKNLENGFDSWNFRSYDEYKQVREEDEPLKEAYAAHIKTAAQWIRENKDRKFFLWVHLLDPHSPYNPPEEYKCAHDPAACLTIGSRSAIDLENYRKEHEGWGQDCTKKNTVPEEDLRLFGNLYDGEISYSDSLLKGLFDTIASTELDKKTIVILCGDHGEGFDHGYYFQHGILYDSNIRIPLIIRHPDYPGRAVSSVLFDNTDILPTLLHLLGIRAETGGDGIDQSWVMTGKRDILDKQRKFQVSVNHNLSEYSITDGVYKYIRFSSDACPAFRAGGELYDLTADRNELTDILQKKSDTPAVRGLENELTRQIQKQVLQKANPPINPEDLERLKNFGYQ